jgi:hypothetical protein
MGKYKTFKHSGHSFEWCKTFVSYKPITFRSYFGTYLVTMQFKAKLIIKNYTQIHGDNSNYVKLLSGPKVVHLNIRSLR